MSYNFTMKSKANTLIGMGIVVLLVIIGLVIFSSNSSDQATAKPETKETVQSINTDVSDSQKPKKKLEQLFSLSGKGYVESTKDLSVPDNWELKWEYSCSDIRTYDSFNLSFNPVDANTYSNNIFETAEGHSGSGTKHYDEGGDFYLSISTSQDCEWKLTGLK